MTLLFAFESVQFDTFITSFTVDKVVIVQQSDKLNHTNLLIRILVRFETFGNVFLFTHSIIFFKCSMFDYNTIFTLNSQCNKIERICFLFSFFLFSREETKKFPSCVNIETVLIDLATATSAPFIFVLMQLLLLFFSSSWLSMSYRVCYTRRIQCAYSLNRESNEQHRLQCIDADWKFFVVNGIYWMNALILTPFTAFDFDCQFVSHTHIHKYIRTRTFTIDRIRSYSIFHQAHLWRCFESDLLSSDTHHTHI